MSLRLFSVLSSFWSSVYMVRHHETSLTKEISSFLAPSHLQSLYSQLSPLPCLPLPPSSSTKTSPVSQVRTIFFTILSIATKSFFITNSIVILKEWKENQKTKSVSIIGGKAATFWKFLRPSNRRQSIFLAVLLYNIISMWWTYRNIIRQTITPSWTIWR